MVQMGHEKSASVSPSNQKRIFCININMMQVCFKILAFPLVSLGNKICAPFVFFGKSTHKAPCTEDSLHLQENTNIFGLLLLWLSFSHVVKDFVIVTNGVVNV